MKAFPLSLAVLGLSGCAALSSPPEAERSPADAFFQRLSSLCGHAYAGRIASPPVDADKAFAGKSLVMQVRECSPDEIRIPFHVGEDRSRTWVVTRTGSGLRLKHDHRHADGSEDRLTEYGGDTTKPGTAERQEFPADAQSRALFQRENIPQSLTNVWALESDGGRIFAYELRRPGRFFRVEFDLASHVSPPPAPWGQE
jgi:hypothetical protein